MPETNESVSGGCSTITIKGLALQADLVRDRRARGLDNKLYEYDDKTFLYSAISREDGVFLITPPLNHLCSATCMEETGKIDLDHICLFESNRKLQPVSTNQTKHLSILRYRAPNIAPIDDTLKNIELRYKVRLNSPHISLAKLKFRDILLLDEPVPISLPPQPQFKVTVSTLMKDETQFLDEWLQYYVALGVEHFYLYDNNTEDQTALTLLLKPWQDRGIVTLIHWNFEYGPTDEAFGEWSKSKSKSKSKSGESMSEGLHSKVSVSDHRYCQPAQTNDALLRFGPNSEWMFLIDVDEYLNTHGSSLPYLSEKLTEKRGDCSILSFASIWFGNPKREPIRVPPGQSVREWYKYRDKKSCGSARRKCLVNPKSFSELNALYHVHGPLLSKKGKMTPGERERLEKSIYKVPENMAILHHYYCCSSKARSNGHNEVKDESLCRLPILNFNIIE